jgi:hypothetical protein
MPRNSAGVYSLPASNPVVPFTTIATSWANPTMSDIAAELTNSLDRTGRGGMLAPFRIFDGTVVQPGLAFANEAGLGLWRSAAGTMHMASLGASVFTFEPGQATSPLKLVHYGTSQFRTTGQNWWEVKVATDNTLAIAPSTAVNGETFDASRALKVDTIGSLSAFGHIVSRTGGLSVGTLAPVSNEVRGNAFITPNGGYMSINTDYVGGTGWTFLSPTGFAILRQQSAGGFIDYVSTTASTGTGNAIAGLSPVITATPAGTALTTQGSGIGIPNLPRTDNSSAKVFSLDINGSGQQSVMFSSNAGSALKMQFGFSPDVYLTFGPTNAGGTFGGANTGSVYIATVRSGGDIQTSIRLHPTGLVQIGDNASTSSAGSLWSTYKYYGLLNGGLDFAYAQTVGVAPGSNITSIVLQVGQIGRVHVQGAGAITLPAYVFSIGSAGNWGTTATIVTFINCNNIIYVTIIPF